VTRSSSEKFIRTVDAMDRDIRALNEELGRIGQRTVTGS
jgi:hypothetical protein